MASLGEGELPSPPGLAPKGRVCRWPRPHRGRSRSPCPCWGAWRWLGPGMGCQEVGAAPGGVCMLGGGLGTQLRGDARGLLSLCGGHCVNLHAQAWGKRVPPHGEVRAGLGAGREAARAQMGKQLHAHPRQRGLCGLLPRRWPRYGPAAAGARGQSRVPPHSPQHGTAVAALTQGIPGCSGSSNQRSAPSQSPLPWLGAGPPRCHGVTRSPWLSWASLVLCHRSWGWLRHAAGDGVQEGSWGGQGLTSGTPNSGRLPPLRAPQTRHR